MNLKTTSKARNKITNPLMMRPAQRPFVETRAVCVSDGINFLQRLPIESQWIVNSFAVIKKFRNRAAP